MRLIVAHLCPLHTMPTSLLIVGGLGNGFLKKGIQLDPHCKDRIGTLQGGRSQVLSARKDACHRTLFMVYLDAKDKQRLLIVVSSFLEKIWRCNAGLLWFQHGAQRLLLRGPRQGLPQPAIDWPSSLNLDS